MLIRALRRQCRAATPLRHRRSDGPTCAAVRAFHASFSVEDNKERILLLDDIQLAKKDEERVKERAEVIRMRARSREEFIKEVNDVQPRALYRHFGAARSITVTGKFDADLVNALPSSLRFLCHNGAGYDQLDVDALTKRGIQASNVPKVVDDATATTALWLLIGALRQFKTAQRQLDEGTFNSKFPFTAALDAGPRNATTLGIIGAGGIGQALARKASAALGMRIIYHNRRRLSTEQEHAMTAAAAAANASYGGGEPARYVDSLEALLRQADAVSVHCPFTPQTRHLLGARQFEQMKTSAVLVNTARGPIIDEEAMAKALEDGKIGGVGLDVYEKEPDVHPMLRSHPRALLLPHVGTLAYGTQEEMERVCLDNILHGLQTGKLAFFVPEQQDKF